MMKSGSRRPFTSSGGDLDHVSSRGIPQQSTLRFAHDFLDELPNNFDLLGVDNFPEFRGSNGRRKWLSCGLDITEVRVNIADL